MKNTSSSIQAENIEKVRDPSYLVEFVHSPYAFSLSFLKDPSLVSKKDEFGISKYKLNLDEELVEKFYQIIKEQEAKNRDLHKDDEDSA